MDYNIVAREVETPEFSASAVHRYIGGNVKSPGLVRGTFYIIKFWSVKSLTSGDNPFWIGQFVGAGTSMANLFKETPRAKDMKSNERYFFQRPSGDVVNAANFNGALIINDDTEQRITFYALLTAARQDALPIDTPALRPDKSSAVGPSSAPRERKQSAQHEPRARQPAAITVTPIRQRREKQEEVYVTPERLQELFKPTPKAELNNFLSAYFNDEADARAFAKQFVGGFYEQDGFSHIAFAPEDGNNSSEFFAKAKDRGAFSRNYHKRLVKTSATS